AAGRPGVRADRSHNSARDYDGMEDGVVECGAWSEMRWGWLGSFLGAWRTGAVGTAAFRGEPGSWRAAAPQLLPSSTDTQLGSWLRFPAWWSAVVIRSPRPGRSGVDTPGASTRAAYGAVLTATVHWRTGRERTHSQTL